MERHPHVSFVVVGNEIDDELENLVLDHVCSPAAGNVEYLSLIEHNWEAHTLFRKPARIQLLRPAQPVAPGAVVDMQVVVTNTIDGILEGGRVCLR